MRKLAVVFTVLLLGFAVLPAASAVDAGPMRGTMTGGTVGFDPNPDMVAKRCPVGFGWILHTAGVVEFESDVYSGSLTLANSHCSRWNHEPKGDGDETLPGKVAAGGMTLTAPNGDALRFVTRGKFVFRGDAVTFSSFTSDVRLVVTVVGGTGMFAGASGHGVLHASDGPLGSSGRLVGSLAIEG